jgi:serine/threonine protein phosphatase PrpC
MPADTRLEAKGFALSHVGATRKRNEDAVYIAPDGSYALLADGMGGHKGGREAARMAVSIMRTHIESLIETRKKRKRDSVSFLKHKFIGVSDRIYEMGQADQSLRDMGATLVCWVRMEDDVLVAHVGDSRAYLLRSGAFLQVTHDHTIENEHLSMGKTREELALLPLRHVLSRNVGMRPAQEPDVVSIKAEENDLWLLCSDGLSNKVRTQQMMWILEKSHGDLPGAAQKLVEAAYAAGGEDNISVCILSLQKSRIS